MEVLVTGGAGFIGRWVVERLLTRVDRVDVIDNLSNSEISNIEEFLDEKSFNDFYEEDILDEKVLNTIFDECNYDVILHLAASINVQDSINDPVTTFNNDCIGTLNILERARETGAKFVYVSTCLVYEKLFGSDITEEYPTNPLSPYSACKLAGEELTLSYYYAYDLPVVILRPFNTYGPFQRTTGEGGVVMSFIERTLSSKDLIIYGDGHQTRDFLYVEDCANFVVKASLEEEAVGEVLNAGTGVETEILQLAEMITYKDERIKFKEHIHPKSEIERSCCNYDKARELLGWAPRVSLEKGIELTAEWVKESLKYE